MLKLILAYFFPWIMIFLSPRSNESSTLRLTKITDQVYSIVAPAKGLPNAENKGWNSNMHFIITEEGVLLFDTGASQEIGVQIKALITTVTDLPVKWIINSHSHADHWLGNAAFSSEVDQIITAKQAFEEMKKYGESDVAFFSKLTNSATANTQLLYPNKLMSKEKKLKLGEFKVEFILTEGAHADSDLMLWFPKKRIMVAGDILSSDWMPIVTDQTEIPVLLATLEKVITLNPAIILIGHGQATSIVSVKRDLAFLSYVWEQLEMHHSEGIDKDISLTIIKRNLPARYVEAYPHFDVEIDHLLALLYQKSKI
ncbi:MBL fold metallo-hydrolase [Marivirga arenosa]|uniref:MBL fold metallo-hydrolase n=1 Tax=Marivirga arenosa TaxID=3059076 RepID=A0AA51ZY26_9BACT|nr:MBL fold metallo-hydrolase [Marivirga sp. BKB1-2]WNB18866.1 MBL fold metallo-hydrolase [Marivirga sp. BKB1-2]